MNTRSSKAKGRRLQNQIRDILRETFPKLEEDDIKSQTMGMTGEDIVLSPAAKKEIPYSFECKNVERLNIWQAIEQSESNCESRTPVVVMKRNRSETYVVFNLNKFIDLIRRENDKTK
tara:strand:+ start:154 stop:507 length:354 start_codon:yes stop_codon:yes gene_type:complete